jgi:hypothetical protein
MPGQGVDLGGDESVDQRGVREWIEMDVGDDQEHALTRPWRERQRRPLAERWRLTRRTGSEAQPCYDDHQGSCEPSFHEAPSPARTACCRAAALVKLPPRFAHHAK